MKSRHSRLGAAILVSSLLTGGIALGAAAPASAASSKSVVVIGADYLSVTVSGKTKKLHYKSTSYAQAVAAVTSAYGSKPQLAGPQDGQCNVYGDNARWTGLLLVSNKGSGVDTDAKWHVTASEKSSSAVVIKTTHGAKVGGSFKALQKKTKAFEVPYKQGGNVYTYLLDGAQHGEKPVGKFKQGKYLDSRNSSLVGAVVFAVNNSIGQIDAPYATVYIGCDV